MQIFDFNEKTTTIKCDGCLKVIRVYDRQGAGTKEM